LQQLKNSIDPEALSPARSGQRSTARMLGVSHTTIGDDLRSGKTLPAPESKALGSKPAENLNGNDLPPE
jgi:hypothetical protein